MLLLFLEPAEEQVEQTLGGCFAWCEPKVAGKKDAGEDSGSNGRPSAPLALIGQFLTQRLLHPY